MKHFRDSPRSSIRAPRSDRAAHESHAEGSRVREGKELSAFPRRRRSWWAEVENDSAPPPARAEAPRRSAPSASRPPALCKTHSMDRSARKTECEHKGGEQLLSHVNIPSSEPVRKDQ